MAFSSKRVHYGASVANVIYNLTITYLNDISSDCDIRCDCHSLIIIISLVLARHIAFVTLKSRIFAKELEFVVRFPAMYTCLRIFSFAAEGFVGHGLCVVVGAAL